MTMIETREADAQQPAKGDQTYLREDQTARIWHIRSYQPAHGNNSSLKSFRRQLQKSRINPTKLISVTTRTQNSTSPFTIPQPTPTPTQHHTFTSHPISSVCRGLIVHVFNTDHILRGHALSLREELGAMRRVGHEVEEEGAGEEVEEAEG